MFSKNLKKDLSFIVLAILLIIFYNISNYFLRFGTIENILIPGICFAFAGLVISWVLTHQSHLRKTWPYITIFILSFIYVSYWKIIYYIYDPFRFLYRNSYSFFQTVFYLQLVINFFIILTMVFIFRYLIKPEEFSKNIYSLFEKKNQRKTILSIAIPFLMISPFIINYISFYLSKDFYHDLFVLNQTFHFIQIFLTILIPYLFAVLIFAILINRLKSKKRFYFYGIIGISTITLYIPYTFYFDIYTTDFDTIKTFLIIKNTIVYLLIFISLLFLSKDRYLE